MKYHISYQKHAPQFRLCNAQALIWANYISAITKAVWLIALSMFITLMYTTPAYADSNVSQSPCNSIDAVSKSFQQYLRCNSRSHRTWCSERHRCHTARMHLGTGSSQSPFSSTYVGGESSAWRLLESTNLIRRTILLCPLAMFAWSASQSASAMWLQVEMYPKWHFIPIHA